MGNTCSMTQNQHQLDSIGDEYLQKIDPLQNPLSINQKFCKGKKQLNLLLTWFHINVQDKFQDTLFPCQLLFRKSASFKRITQVFPDQPFCSQNMLFNYSLLGNFQADSNKNFRQAMLILRKHPQIIKQQIFTYSQIFQCGLYRLNFHLNGSRKKQMIIDDFIPVDSFGKYWYDSPQPGGGIWMVLIEKALAKVLGSYQKISNLTKQQILAQITGFPSIQKHQQIGFKNQQGFIDFDPFTAKYLKATGYDNFNFILALWFPINNQNQSQFFQGDYFVIEVFQQLYLQKYKKIKTKQINNKQLKNITIIAAQDGEIIRLTQKQTIIRIYNRSSFNLSFNFVCQSSQKIGMMINQIKQSFQQCKRVKNSVILQQFQQKKFYNQSIQTLRYRLRTLWIGHRGYFRIINNLEIKQKITFKILPDKHRQIKFEDYPQLLERSKIIDQKPGKSQCTFIVNRERNLSYGIFYQIQAIDQIN